MTDNKRVTRECAIADLDEVLRKAIYAHLAEHQIGEIKSSVQMCCETTSMQKKKSVFGMNARLTSLSDISIYTTEEEVPLNKILVKMHENLQDNPAPGPKSDPEILKNFFAEVLPDYDRERFYASHMKKVVDWYNTLKEYASLDFELPEEKEGAEEAAAKEQ